MTAKRDYIDEILSKKQRLNPTSRRWELISNRINDLSKLTELLGVLEPQVPDRGEITKFEGLEWELARYIPVGFVACIEGYFRIVYANMIDYGAPFRDNSSRFDIKFSISTALSLQKHSVSLGEFIAHFLPTNNLDDINKNVSTIIGEDFLFRFKEKREQLDRRLSLIEISSEEVSAYLLNNINRLFEFRHKYCHEADPPMTQEDLLRIRAFPRDIIEFLWTSEALVSEILE